MKNFSSVLGFCLLLYFMMSLRICAEAATGQWTKYETLNDNAQNGIDFSWKKECKRLNDKNCRITWKWRNRYKGTVSFSYRISYIGEQGERVIQQDDILLSGESAEQTLIGETLKMAQVGVEKQDIANLSLITFADAEAKLASERRNAIDEERYRQLEAQGQEQMNAAEYQRREQNSRADDSAFIQREKQAERAELQSQILDLGRTLTNSAVQGSQQIEDARQQRYALERKQKEENERHQREETRRQAEEQRHRDFEASERRRVAEEKRQQEERDWKERERVAREQAERKKQEQCRYVTASVKAEVTHPTGKKDATGITTDEAGLIVPGEMDLFMTNISASKLDCIAVPVKSGVQIDKEERIIRLQPYENYIGKSRISGRKTHWGACSSTDTVRFSCTEAGDLIGNGTCNYKALGLR